MRSLALLAVGLLPLGGCSRGAAPSAVGSPAALPAPSPAPSVEGAAPAAIIVLSHRAAGGRRVLAVPEDRPEAAVALSREGVDSELVLSLPARRALLAERQGGKLAAFYSIAVDGSARVELGAPPAGRYQAVATARLATASAAAGPGAPLAVIEVVSGDGQHDLLVLTAGAAPALLVADARLAAVAGGRAAWAHAGGVESARLDGSERRTLGAGDGFDQVVQAQGDRLLLSVHGPGRGDVRVVSLDGRLAVDLGQENADEAPFALLAGRAIYRRATDAGAVLVSGALDGSSERLLTDPGLDAIPRLASDRGLVFFESGAGALMAVDAAGGAVRTLDAAAGPDVVVSQVLADRVIYTGTGTLALSLRAARLDGGGATVLCEQPLWLPYFAAASPDGRVVFHRALAAQLEGGAAFSVKLDGTELRPLGTQVLLGGAAGPAPADQDFEAITPAGRVILEAEFEGLADAQLLLASTSTPLARGLAQQPGLKFAALIP